MYSLARVRTMFALILTLSFTSIANAAYTELVGFGDSLSDTGNVFAVTGSPAPPYFDGRFSNGPVWLEDLAMRLGLAAPAASENGGTNYAWGGARTLVDSGFLPSTQSQVDQYLLDVGGVANPDALYTILTGGNDVNAVAQGEYTPEQLAAAGFAVADIANDLLDAGAQHILILNVPDVGTAPASNGFEDIATALSTIFNDALAAGLVNLGSTQVTLVDAFTQSQLVAANPELFGITNATDSCLVDTGGIGSPCDGYLFWDDLHPTGQGHVLFSDAAYAAVIPIPAAAWLFGSALLGLAGLRRMRA